MLKKLHTFKSIIFFLFLLAILAIAYRAFKKPSLEISDSVPSAIILITVDTLRADHLSCYGYPRKTSPFLDQLAFQGILFERAFTSMPSTVPSHASLFTSLHPIQHRVLRNAHKLHSQFTTLAEWLQYLGYRTIGVVSANAHFNEQNLDQGFDVFDEPILVDQTSNTLVTRSDFETIQRAIQLIQKIKENEKLFLWVHLWAPHAPYTPPQKYRSLVKDQSKIQEKDFIEFLISQHHTDLPFFSNDTRKMLWFINAYDGEVRYSDAAIQTLYQYLDKQPFHHKALWIITSDHGEGLGNHRWMEHSGHLHNELLRVPLLFHFTSGLSSGLIVDHIVEHVDIVPTLIDLLDKSTRHIFTQNKSFSGASLVDLLLNRNGTWHYKSAFSQRKEKLSSVNKPKPAGRMFSIQNNHFKYISSSVEPDQFFNLENDPYEINNMMDSDIEEIKALRNELLTRVEKYEQEKLDKISTIDESTAEKLYSLGYL